jgi:hypothetical protein
MTTKTERSYSADLIKEEPFRQISRSLGTISSAAAAMVPKFTVLGIITASGKYLPYNPAANDGTQVAAAILIAGNPAVGAPTNPGDADASAADVPNCVLLDCLAVVDSAFLVWGAGVTTQAHKNAAYAAFAAKSLKASLPA